MTARMTRRAIIGLLIALNLWALGCSLNPLYVAVSDNSPLLHAITEPEEWIRPWGPPLLLAALLAMLGSRRPAKIAARAAAAVAFYGALYWTMLCYAFAGYFALESSDWAIVGGLLILALLLGWWGFGRDS